MILTDDVVERVARALDPDAWRIADEAGGYDKARGIRRALDYSLRQARAALEAARWGEMRQFLADSRSYLEAFRLKEAGKALMGEIDRMPVRQLCKHVDALLSTIGAA